MLEGKSSSLVEQRAAWAMAERLAEATGDADMAAAALLHGLLIAGTASIDDIAAAVSPKVAKLADNSATMVSLHSDARDFLW